MSFWQSLHGNFPNAIDEHEFVKKSQIALSRHGFTADNTIACIGVCRDELTRSFIDSVQSVWGEAFNFSSLGGMLFLGKTGFIAAHQHAPIEGGRERYIYFAMPHIAIDTSGQVGSCRRTGRSDMSVACGALMALRQELMDGRISPELDMDDIEQSLLKRRIVPELPIGQVPDLVTLTKVAHKVIFEDLERCIGMTVNTSQSDYAVLSGIQIHGPNKDQYIWPGGMYVMKSGQRSALSLNDRFIQG